MKYTTVSFSKPDELNLWCVFIYCGRWYCFFRERYSMNQKEIGKFIASCRKNREMTQSGLAEKLGVSINAVSKWGARSFLNKGGIEVRGIEFTFTTKLFIICIRYVPKINDVNKVECYNIMYTINAKGR